jgi:hypothetical protein
MRDDPMDSPIPDAFVPDTYHARELAMAREQLADMQSWDDGRWAREAAKTYAKSVTYAQERNAESAVLRQRYEAMLAEVEAWQPPTDEHLRLRKFMTEQLTSSIEHDCWDADEPVAVAASDYRDQQLARTRWSIEYHSREYDAEVSRAIGRSEWLRDLRASLHAEG